jgi:hypothetical protein
MWKWSKMTNFAIRLLEMFQQISQKKITNFLYNFFARLLELNVYVLSVQIELNMNYCVAIQCKGKHSRGTFHYKKRWFLRIGWVCMQFVWEMTSFWETFGWRSPGWNWERFEILTVFFWNFFRGLRSCGKFAVWILKMYKVLTELTSKNPWE